MDTTQFAMVNPLSLARLAAQRNLTDYGSTSCDCDRVCFTYFYFLILVEQIEELASLVRDNLYSKHLVLSTEEFLVTLLQHQYHEDDDDEHDRDMTGTHRGSVGNTIELQPTSSYNRLLLHRLADIYGYSFLFYSCPVASLKWPT
jgi:hypothetical protein